MHKGWAANPCSHWPVVPPDLAEAVPDDGLWVGAHPHWFQLMGFGEPMKGKQRRGAAEKKSFPPGWGWHLKGRKIVLSKVLGTFIHATLLTLSQTQIRGSCWMTKKKGRTTWKRILNAMMKNFWGLYFINQADKKLGSMQLLVGEQRASTCYLLIIMTWLCFTFTNLSPVSPWLIQAVFTLQC